MVNYYRKEIITDTCTALYYVVLLLVTISNVGGDAFLCRRSDYVFLNVLLFIYIVISKDRHD